MRQNYKTEYMANVSDTATQKMSGLFEQLERHAPLEPVDHWKKRREALLRWRGLRDDRGSEKLRGRSA